MNRFFAEKSTIGETVTLTDENAHHITNVLRLQKSDEIIVCDLEGTDYRCVIESLHTKKVTAAILSSAANTAEPAARITLYQGYPKGDKLDFIIQKAVELGVYKIVPVVTEFSVKRPEGKAAKTARFMRISEAAAKQSGRGIIPEVCEVQKLSDVVKTVCKNGLAMVAYEKEQHESIKGKINKLVSEISVFIGPEGGFSVKEIEYMTSLGVATVSLGKRILRTETAGIYMLAVIDYELGCCL